MTNWKKIKETLLHDGYRGILQKQFELPNGHITDFDIVQNEVFVTIAAFTSDHRALLVRQFRPGPEKVLVSFPEGAVDEGEEFETAARRELLEETGYVAGKVTLLKILRSAYTTEKQICLLAENCHRVANQELDESEFIEVFTMGLPEFKNYIQDSTNENFTNVDAAYLALAKLDLL